MQIKGIMTRAASGTIYVALIVGCLLWGNIPFWILAEIIALIAAVEFFKISSPSCQLRLTTTSMVDLLAVFSLVAVAVCDKALVLWVVCLLVRLGMQIFNIKSEPLHSVSRSSLVQIWIALPILLTLLNADEISTRFVLAVFIMIWLNDTGAFLVGTQIGRHRLYEAVSPKKSWEGFWGGMLFCLAFAVALSLPEMSFFGPLPLWAWATVAIIVSLTATLGDLFESKVKRSLNIKDSGNIIPGHGGILDRIDSWLFVMPAIWVFLQLYINFMS